MARVQSRGIFDRNEIPDHCRAFIDPTSPDAGRRIFKVIDSFLILHVADNIMFPPGSAQQPDKERYAILYSAAKHTEARSWALAAMDPVLKALLGFDAAADFTARAPPIVPALAESPLEFIYCRPGTSGASQARADRPLRAFAQAPGQPDNGRMPL